MKMQTQTRGPLDARDLRSLSWLIEDGDANGTDLSQLPVAMAVRYSDNDDVRLLG